MIKVMISITLFILTLFLFCSLRIASIKDEQLTMQKKEPIKSNKEIIFKKNSKKIKAKKSIARNKKI